MLFSDTDTETANASDIGAVSTIMTADSDTSTALLNIKYTYLFVSLF